MDDRESRNGYWVSGVAHTALILWAIVGGALFRPQPSPPVRSTQVSTISGADFEKLAAASRGKGPVGAEASSIANQSDQQLDANGTARPVDAQPPRPVDASQLAEPDQSEAVPDLSDFEAGDPVEVETDLPAATAQDRPEATPRIPAVPAAPAPAAQPSQPVAAAPDQAAEPAPVPRSALALDTSPRPQDRPAGLEENYNRRQAAAAEAARAAEERAAEQRAANAAAAEQAAEDAAREQAAARAEAEAEERRAAAAAEREAEERRAAAAAEREAEERRAAAAAERDEADRRALEDALRQAQEGQGGGGEQDSASTGETSGGDRQSIEGGSGASAGLDPLAAALAGAMAGNGDDAGQNNFSGPPRDMMQLVPSPDRDTSGNNGAEAVPMGEPMSFSEREGLRFAIQNCWNVGALSVEASRMTVSVGFSLTPQGVPDQNSLRIVDFNGGSEAGAQQAFEVARRAILMCGRSGFDLPASKYGRWRDVVVDFRPDGVEF